MSSFPSTPYTPRHTSWPYKPSDFVRLDESSDPSFYSYPRFVTHIDDTAIAALRRYYAENLPRTGRVLDICSSWISHFPKELEKRAVGTAQRLRGSPEGQRGGSMGASEAERRATSTASMDATTSGENLEVIGMGMNDAELAANPILSSYHLIDLNASPILPPTIIPEGRGGIDAATCVVSIDYLTKPLDVLSSLRELMNPGGKVHLAISNRCFYTKVIGRWLKISEEERVRMVADYLHFAGYEKVEMVEVVKADQGGFKGGTDPLWEVRGRKGD